MLVEAKQLQRAEVASRTFGCIPYMAIVVDGGSLIRCFVLPLKTFYVLYPSSKTQNAGWRMTDRAIARYYEHPEVKIFEFMSDTKRWW